MLKVLNELPNGLLDLAAARLHEVLAGPTLIHLPGRRPEPLFASVLLHGNEDTGWEAMRRVLGRYARDGLPRALSLFIGNIAAARVGERFLPGQPDFNRIWERLPGVAGRPEHAMADAVVAELRARRPFVSIDIHNNSGFNPHYACVRVVDAAHLHLATLFSRTVVYFLRPAGVQTAAFVRLCPAVTVECGQSGDEAGVAHAAEYIDACLHLSALPTHPVAAHDIDLFHTVAVVKVPSDVPFSFGEPGVMLKLPSNLDRLNFRELPPGTAIGWTEAAGVPLEVRDERGQDVADRYFHRVDSEIRTVRPVMPSMLTVSVKAVRQDCLGYLMERYPGAQGVARAPH